MKLTKQTQKNPKMKPKKNLNKRKDQMKWISLLMPVKILKVQRKQRMMTKEKKRNQLVQHHLMWLMQSNSKTVVQKNRTMTINRSKIRKNLLLNQKKRHQLSNRLLNQKKNLQLSNHQLKQKKRNNQLNKKKKKHPPNKEKKQQKTRKNE